MEDSRQHRLILVDPHEPSREVMVRRLRAQGYTAEAYADPSAGADAALSSPPSALIADLWMPSVSGVQLCRLMRAEAATAEVPIILRGPLDDPRSRFWAERAGATAYVARGRMAELVRVLTRSVTAARPDAEFFMQLSGGSLDIRERIARHLDQALFDSVIAAEVRALASCGSFERLFDVFSQFFSQVASYRWMAMVMDSPERFAIHHNPRDAETAEAEARQILGVRTSLTSVRVEDEDAGAIVESSEPIVRIIPFGVGQIGTLALAPSVGREADAMALLSLVARELGAPLRIAVLMDESQRLATVDPLTGLLNRRAFLEVMHTELAHAKRYGSPFSLLLLDVDHFKLVNDTHGHAAGDQVLSAVGALLQRELRAPDTAARWGGEEFVIALRSTGETGAVGAGDRIRTALQALEIGPPGKTIRVTASIGAAQCASGESVEGITERADQAMYRAKLGGRNRVELSALSAIPTEVATSNGTSNPRPAEAAASVKDAALS